MRILHVTDAYAAGVKQYIDNLAQKQVQQGNEVHVLALTRRDVSFDLRPNFRSFHLKIYGRNSIPNILKLTFKLVLVANNFDYIHLHSSRFGLIGRFISLFRKKTKYFYTPHGYAHLRKDIGQLQRKIYHKIESLTGQISGVKTLAVGTNEFEETRSLGLDNVDILRALINIPNELVKLQRFKQNTRPKIAYLCRNSPAKDPAYFLKLAKLNSDIADFFWIGANTSEFEDAEISNYVCLLGQLDHEEALKALDRFDVLVVTSLWEVSQSML